MAVSATAALIRAHYRSTRNQIVRDTGFGGIVATGVMIAMVAFIVLIPCLFALSIGLTMGAELATSTDAGMLRSWSILQAVLTTGFGILGGFRLKPAFPFRRFGHYPLTPLQLLLAELPASFLEVFPLLGIGATLFTNVGLAVRMPEMSPFILILAFDGVVTLMATMFITSALWAAIRRHRVVMLILAGLLLTTSLMAGLRGLRIVMKEWLPAFTQALPLSHGYDGLMAFRSGDAAGGLEGGAIATVASLLLLLIATHVHRRRLMAEFEFSGWRSGREKVLRFRTPAAGIARLFLRQLLESTALRAQLVMPPLFTACFALFVWIRQSAMAAGEPLPDNLLTFVNRFDLPWFAVVPTLAVMMNPQIWMNQFGWDRGGFRTLLLLPIEPRDVLIGKLRGLAGFTAIQTAIGILPLFTVRMPTIREAILAVAAGGTLLIVTTAVGHIISIRFPRGVDGSAGMQIPLHLAWISPVVFLASAGGMLTAYEIGEMIGTGGGVIALALSFAGAIAGYIAILPMLGELLHTNRERVLAM